MARPGQIDHVAEGIARLPEKLRAPRVVQYLSVYLAQFNNLEEPVQQIIEAFLTWQVQGKQFDFVLDTIGALFDQPRPDGFDNEAYAFILQARVLVRRSEATLDDVLAVANYLAQGKTVKVFRTIPKQIIVVFVDLLLTPQEQDLYAQLLTDAIDAVDGLDVQYVTSATAFYDVGLYDTDLYA